MTSTTNEQIYLDNLAHVLRNGHTVPDRTNVGTRRIIGMMNRFDLTQGFPLLTTKKLDLNSVSSELIWFVEGSGDERRLAELRYGKPRSELTNKKTIWTDNAKADYWISKAGYPGDLGRVYGVQWRNWLAPTMPEEKPADGRTTTSTIAGVQRVSPIEVRPVDQLQNLIHGIKKDPYGRRHIITAWNPGEIDKMALPPCHVLSQYFVHDGKLSSLLYQRSCDKFLGEPYNIASYALMTHMVAQVCDLEVGEFIHMQGDTHIYENHLDAVQEQLSRTPTAAPRLVMDRSIKRIEDFTVGSFALEGYEPQAVIKAPMAV